MPKKVFAKGEWRNQAGERIGGFEIRAADEGEQSNEAEILIYGDIGESLFGESVTAAQFVRELQEIDAEYLTVRINSFGGSVADGLAIYNAIRRHDSAKTVEIDGVAMSAASLVAMAGDTVRMAENGIFMVHAPWGFAIGNAVFMREYADILDKYAEAMSASYARKTGRPKKEMLELVTDGKDHFFNAEEALEAKFIDAISEDAPAEGDQEAAMQVLRAAAARYRIPATLVAAASINRQENSPMIKPTPTPAAHQQPANPAPGAAPSPASSNVEEISRAAEARLREQLAERNKALAAAFKPFLDLEGVQALYDEVLADPHATVDQGRERLLKKLGESVTPATPAGAAPIQPGQDARDKWLRGAQAWIVAKAGQANLVRRAAPNEALDPGEFRGMTMTELARDALQRAGVHTRGMSKMELVAAALRPQAAGLNTQSDFPVLLENTMHKILLAAYATTPDTWSRFCFQGSVSDFRPHNRYRMGSFSKLDRLNEHGEFKNKNIPDGEKELIAAATSGNIIGITRQALVNDDMDAFSRLATMLGRAARLSVEIDVYDLLKENAGLGPNMNDGQPLFDAAHKNINAEGSALSVEGIDKDRVVMASQKDPSGNEILDLRPAVLVVPIGLGGTARVINDAQFDPDTANKLQRPNKVRGLFRDIVDTPRLEGTRRYLFADPSVAPTIEVAFLDGQMEPVLENRDAWRFDGVEWRVRFDYGVGAIDFRGAVTNAGQ